MKTKILSATMSAVMLFTALSGTAAAAHAVQPTTSVPPAYITTSRSDSYEHIVSKSYVTTTPAEEHIHESADKETALEKIISTLRSLIDRFISFLKSAFDKDEKPEESNRTDGPIYFTDKEQFTLADDSEAAALCDEFNSLMLGFDELEADAEVTKDVVVDIAVTDMELPAAAESIVNEAIEYYLVNDTKTEKYYKGDYVYLTPYISIHPSGLKKAEKTIYADGSSRYEFELIEEAAYYNGYSTSGIYLLDGEPMRHNLYHAYAADVLYVELFDFSPCRINRASILYPGAKIKAVTDNQGRITSLSVEMPVQGTGEVNVLLIKGTLSLEGCRNEYYTIKW